MSAKTGAGASVSSGAHYQARIGGYLLVTSLCDAESAITDAQHIISVGFETTESIDDINVTLAGGSIVYIQAKSTIDFSNAKGSELWSVLNQFERQHRSRTNASDRYFLITTSRSSRKVTYEMRAALEAFRLGPEQAFRRDQPKALVQVIDELLSILTDLRSASGLSIDGDIARGILRKSYVLSMDIDNGDPMEQGVLLILQSRGFAAPTPLWGKIVADCVSHAKSRHTVNIADVAAFYERFRVKDGKISEQASDDLLKFEFGKLDLAVGREVVLCRFPAKEGIASGLVLMELYRFDDKCGERTTFSGNTCRLLNGLEVSLVRRAATYQGLTRLIEHDSALVGGEKLTIIPMNSKEDYEVGLCAETHRKRLRKALLANPRPLYCIHCGNPASSIHAQLVESGRGDNLAVGLSHDVCLAPDDRILGGVRSQFFEEHPELINFDPNAWFRALHGGQIAFANAQSIRGVKPFIAWGGRRLRAPLGRFVVEMQLEEGELEYVTSRNSIDRYSKSEAEEFVARLNEHIRDQRNDPLCYTDQTKSFGARSVLLQQIGGKERCLPVKGASVKIYDERTAARYTRPGSWYAPVLYLRDSSTSGPFSILGSVVLLTDPMSLANYLENWRAAGLPVPKYETMSLLTDDEFDKFMLWLDDEGTSVVVNPMFVVDTSTRIASGIPIASVELMSRHI